MIGAINNGKFEDFDFIVVNENKDNSNSVCGHPYGLPIQDPSSGTLNPSSKHNFSQIPTQLLIVCVNS